MTKERAEKIIDKKVDRAVQEYEDIYLNEEYDDEITEDDVKSWGYDNWDDFWESHI